MADDRSAWEGIVAILREMPDLAARLRATHIPDGNGRCRGCTTPGRGTPNGRYPCAIAVIASAPPDP